MESRHHRPVPTKVVLAALLRPGIVYEDIQLAKLVLYVAEDCFDLFRARDITLDHETIGTELADFCQRIDCGSFLLVVMDNYLDVTRRQLNGNSSPMPRELPVISAYVPSSDISTSRCAVHDRIQRPGP
jgi:hypothetical protein